VPAADVIVACDLAALLLSSSLQERLMPTAKIVAAAFSPREYCWRRSLFFHPWSRHVSRRVIRELPVENLVFATDGMVRQTSECAGRDFSESPVFPLAIDVQNLHAPSRRPVDRRKIVSVTRLVKYYPHHLHMVRVIRQLRDAGYDFEYHSYGDGAERQRLEAEAHALGVTDAVFFHRAIPYEQFQSVVLDAFAYIGAGTAMIEAAACGVPTLVAPDLASRPMTYGFVQDTVGNDLGGYVPGHAEQPIAERILWLASLDDERYGEVGEASRRRAEEFDISALAPKFVAILEKAKSVSLRLSRIDVDVGRVEGFAFSTVLPKLGVRDSWQRRHAVFHTR
jgi:glycosyltransferase involved in cell wall biosynthesis